jgi:YidC/Oxa1 family membrane protein insertase
MDFLILLYNEILYRPLLNALVLLTGFVPGHDVGIAIILLTILIRFILFPVNHRSLITQIRMKQLEPEINKIRSETKDKTQEQGKRIMELYKNHGVSPFFGCLTLLVQLPILIALFKVFSDGLSFDGAILYSFVPALEFTQLKLFGLLDISKTSIFLSVLAGVSQFFQMRLAMPNIPKGGKSMREEMGRAMAIQARYVFPFLIFFIAFRFPAALPLYWTVTNLFATVHEGFVRKRAQKIYGGAENKN